ncbi:3-oxo-5-alpha-steroid 4-dehydrogenase [Myriangium duriaei CBS 260.36]|uniref:3-oxo-5-alpha-steroid 4-dehydrogenase n=1 Tax=Myriangium duriaei CBS 260.36 TaxID=1168546 RepID=A0A9P4J9N2_9PEZI|nr:3-oxo-5-alpha-steroid 4-dehydrogenase [Myriangium duriaei CBS 260.36]
MTLIPGVLPPSIETYNLACQLFKYFPLFASVQWLTAWYPAGKTSIDSRFNLPGRFAWAVMETPGLAIVLYSILTLPDQLGLSPLPWANYTLAGLYVIHYVYRAWLYPLMAPSMSPIHPLPFLGAILFNVLNGLSIGGWTGGYGPTTVEEWSESGTIYRLEIGMVIWGWSLLAVIFHDDDLREIRRAAGRIQKEKAEKEGGKAQGVDKVYMVPKNGLFKFILYPHYFCEWIEWTGYWIIGGWGFGPARTFLINEISAMLPRAVRGRRWYIEKFGKEKIGSRKAVIPGIL